MNQSELEAQHATGAKCGKTRVSQVMIGFSPDWLKNSVIAVIGRKNSMLALIGRKNSVFAVIG